MIMYLETGPPGEFIGSGIRKKTKPPANKVSRTVSGIRDWLWKITDMVHVHSGL